MSLRTTSFDRITIPPGTSHALLAIGNLGNLVVNCSSFGATFQFHNTTGGAETVFTNNESSSAVESVGRHDEAFESVTVNTSCMFQAEAVSLAQ